MLKSVQHDKEGYMKNALILHDHKGSSKANWYSWLQKELEQQGYTVWVPDMPNAHLPTITEWKEHILANKEFVFGKETVVIGHGAGATFILGLLESLPRTVQIPKAILVAAFMEEGERKDLQAYKKGLLKGFDWKKIQKSCRRFYFIASDNDIYLCGDDQAQILQDRLGGEVVILSGAGHVTGVSYRQFPEVLKYI